MRRFTGGENSSAPTSRQFFKLKQGKIVKGGKSIIAVGRFWEILITNVVGADLHKIDAAVFKYFKDQPFGVTY
jgi:hypothetical protein